MKFHLTKKETEVLIFALSHYIENRSSDKESMRISSSCAALRGKVRYQAMRQERRKSASRNKNK